MVRLVDRHDCTSFEEERMASYDQQVRSIPNVQWRASQTLNFVHVSSAPLCALVDFERSNFIAEIAQKDQAYTKCSPSTSHLNESEQFTLQGREQFSQCYCEPLTAPMYQRHKHLLYDFAHARTGVLKPVLYLFRAPSRRYQHHSFINSFIHSSFICSSCKIKRGFCYSE